MSELARPAPVSGLTYALCAFAAWGLFPVFFAFTREVPPVELVAWRIVFTLPICLAALAFSRQSRAVWTAFATPRTLAALATSGALIGTNWLIYVFAVTRGHVLAASLGYYINPLVNVLIGTAFLGELLTKRRWLAVAIAALGVAVLAWGALEMLWISVSLAITFGIYGLLRKVAPVDALPGLTVETLLLLGPALVGLGWFSRQPGGTSIGESLQLDLMLWALGPLTAIPMLMFAAAARRMNYSTLGFVQYLTPTMVFILGLTIFHEPLRPVQLASFAMIWAAIALYIWDIIASSKRAREA